MDLIIGDLHLGITWDGLDRTSDIFQLLEDIYKYYAVPSNGQLLVKRIVWLGDIFDSPHISHTIVSDFIKYLSKWTLVEHIILKGNHDGEPDSRKGSPLQEVEASGVAQVIWEPQFVNNELFLPYTTSNRLESIKVELVGKGIHRAFSHLDIIGATPGLEASMGRGAPCVLPEWLLALGSFSIYSGHIHTPQNIGYIKILGSVICCDTSEKGQTKIILELDGKNESYKALNSRPLEHFDILLEKDKQLFLDLLDGKGYTKDSIVSVNVICPHTVAHEYNQIEFQDKVRQKCHYLRFDFKVVKEKSYRIEELSNELSDFEMVSMYIQKQGINLDSDTLIDINKIMKGE